MAYPGPSQGGCWGAKTPSWRGAGNTPAALCISGRGAEGDNEEPLGEELPKISPLHAHMHTHSHTYVCICTPLPGMSPATPAGTPM